MQVAAVLADAPDAVERDFKRKKDTGGGDEQHDDREELGALVGMGEELHVAHDEVLSYRQEVFHHVSDDLFHGAGVEDVSAERQQ